MTKQTIEIILSTKVDSFGTKSLIFMNSNGLFFVTRDEGEHFEIAIGQEVYASPWESRNVTL